MILIPAIDLKGGVCVRLYKGDMDKATVFNDDPAAQAHDFTVCGCHWLHVVDLDGAFAGRPVNADAVEAISEVAAMAGVPVQLGGGIRNLDTVAYWLERGVARVIFGTAALTNPDMVKQACADHPGRVAVGIDARNGLVATEGWAETSDVTAQDLAHTFEDYGVAAIIYTDIDRDGALAGPNVEATVALARGTSIPVVASGGVSSMDDLRALKEQEESGIAGVIIGRALYGGGLDLKKALALMEG